MMVIWNHIHFNGTNPKIFIPALSVSLALKNNKILCWAMVLLEFLTFKTFKALLMQLDNRNK